MARGNTCAVGACAKRSRYECPRCGVAYCSAACYAGHSDACVSAFRAEGEALLRGVRATESERAAMREILRRAESDGGASDAHAFVDTTRGIRAEEEDDGIFWNESDSEEEWEGGGEGDGDSSVGEESEEDEAGGKGRCDGLDAGYAEKEGNEGEEEGNDEAEALEKLLQEMEVLNLEYEDALARLPAALAADFKAQVADGRIARLVPAWRPWWLRRDGDDFGDGGDGEDDARYDEQDDGAPPPRAACAADCAVAPGAAFARAAPALLYSVVEVVAAYCAAARRAGGAAGGGAARAAVAGSAVLVGDARFADADAVLAAVRRRGGGGGLSAADVSVADVAADVAAVLRRPGAAGRVLLELQGAADAEGKAGRKAGRKVGFLLAYVVGAEGDVAHRRRELAVAREAAAWSEREAAREARNRFTG